MGKCIYILSYACLLVQSHFRKMLPSPPKYNIFGGFQTEAKAFKSKFSQEILSAMRCIRLMVWCRWTMTPLSLIKVSAREEKKKSTTKKPLLIPSLYLLSHQSLRAYSPLCISVLVAKARGGFSYAFPFNFAKTIPQIARHSPDSTPAFGIKGGIFPPPPLRLRFRCAVV